MAAEKTRPGQPKEPRDRKHVVKHVTVDQRVDKYGKYGLYDNNGLLFCKCCGKQVDCHREDSIWSHAATPFHEQSCEKNMQAGAPFVLAPVVTNISFTFVLLTLL